MFELLRNSGYDRTLGFLSYNRSWEVDWSLCKLSWYPGDFDARLVSCIEATADPGRKHLNDSAVLADGKLLEVPLILVEDASMSLSKEESQGRQFLSAQYPGDVEEYPARAFSEYRRPRQ